MGWVSAALALLLVAGVAGWQLGWFDRFLDEDEPPTDDPASVAPPPEVDVPPVRTPRPVAPAADARTRLDTVAVESAMTDYLTNRNLGRHVLAAVAPLNGNSGYGYGSSAGRPRDPGVDHQGGHVGGRPVPPGSRPRLRDAHRPRARRRHAASWCWSAAVTRSC